MKSSLYHYIAGFEFPPSLVAFRKQDDPHAAISISRILLLKIQVS